MCAGPQLDVRKPSLKLPPKAADCHAHVFGPEEQYPRAAARLFTPPPVFLEDYFAMHRATGFERGVLVQTGVHGNDNRFIVDAIKAHPTRLRGIALIEENITDRDLQHLAENGVRGFRVNRTAKTGLAFDVARRLSDRVKDLGWHVQFLLDVEDHPDLDTLLGNRTQRGTDHAAAASLPLKVSPCLPAEIVTFSPSLTLPARIISASGSWIDFWITRLSGRAP
jgi:predicted TIM-barrel fold metal-dependent hydrolase